MRPLLPVLICTALLAACEDGRLDLAIADAPVDGATAVVVRFTGVTLEHEDGESERIDFNPPRDIDLFRLQGGDSELLLSDAGLPSGTYRRIRLRVQAGRNGGESYVETAQGRRTLYLPSNAESSLTLEGSFELPEDEKVSYTIDFDLRRSVREPEDSTADYVLRPALRIVETDRAGAIGGAVAASRVPNGCTPAVYAYTGGSVTPDDVGGSGAQPLTSTRVEAQLGSGELRYQLAFLPEGRYTVAFTCDALRDDPARNDDLRFVTQEAEVRAGRTATLNFQ